MITLLDVAKVLQRKTGGLPVGDGETIELCELVSLEWKGNELILMNTDEIGKRNGSQCK